MEGYLTIAEFAKQANITRQAVYQRINGELQSYVKIIDNKKYIGIRALGKFAIKENNQYDNPLEPYYDETKIDTLNDEGYISEYEFHSSKNFVIEAVEDMSIKIIDTQQELLRLLKEQKEYDTKKTDQQTDHLFLLKQINQNLSDNQLLLIELISLIRATPTGFLQKIKNKFKNMLNSIIRKLNL